MRIYMNRIDQLLKTIALAGLLAHLPAQAAPQEQVDKAVAGCKGNRGTSIGQMPWGATDQDLVSYKGKNLCTSNKGRPIGTNCEKTLDKLYEVASELNRMVKTGCEKFMPMFVGNKELQNCMMGGQSACTESNQQQLAPVKAELAKFRVKLKQFQHAMGEQQKYVAKSSKNVVQVLQQNESARNTASYSNSGYSASQMAVSSISESDKLNNFQDAGVAQAIVQEIQSRFADSDSAYTNVSEANYEKLRQPIEDSFKEVGQLQSRVLREQLHGYLKAEELKLATSLYDNQLAQTEATTNKIMAANENSTANMNSLGAAAGAAPLLAGLGSQTAGSGLADNPYPYANGIQSSVAEAASTTTKAAQNGATQLAQLSADKPAANDDALEIGGTISSSAASRSPASLRDSIRKKLALETKGGTAGGASMASGAQGTEDSENANQTGSSLAAKAGSGEDFAVNNPGGAGATDPLLEGFNVGTLDQGGLYIAGSGIEESVKELVGEFESAMGGREELGNDIAGAESPSLFARVRDFHDRCLKRGCVVGTGKGEI
jgi:hypothetical protein